MAPPGISSSIINKRFVFATLSLFCVLYRMGVMIEYQSLHQYRIVVILLQPLLLFVKWSHKKQE